MRRRHFLEDDQIRQILEDNDPPRICLGKTCYLKNIFLIVEYLKQLPEINHEEFENLSKNFIDKSNNDEYIYLIIYLLLTAFPRKDHIMEKSERFRGIVEKYSHFCKDRWEYDNRS